MTASTPRVHTIPAGVPFVDTLAQGLYARAGGDPLTLAGMIVLLPQRRAVRALQEAFLRLSGGRALLLPRMVPVGDVDVDDLLLAGEAAVEAGLASGGLDLDLPEPMPATRRQFLLTQLIARWGEADPGQTAPTVDHAARLAAELARLVDQVETEGLRFDALADLVPERHAEHWRKTLDFLRIITETWPQIEAEAGYVGPAQRRRRLMQAQAAAWRAAPPDGPVIAAGSTGSIPATADLLAVVATLPEGAVVLPGLDRDADAETWAAITDDPTHPQHTMAKLLDRLEVARESVTDWPAPESPRGSPATVRRVRPAPPARADLLALALRPARVTPDWRAAAQAGDAARLAQGLSGVRRLDCPGPGEEAEVIALMLRGALEEDGKTAALVTPDRHLARRVTAALARWGLAVDDSAGTPLANTAPGSFLRLTAALLAEDLAPLPLLATLKHPLAAGGESTGAFRRKVRLLERRVLRGPRPPGGFDGLLAAVDADAGARDLRPWLESLRDLAAPAVQALHDADTAFGAAFEAHMRLAEALAADATTPGAARLWAGEAGEALAAFAAEVMDSADVAPALDGSRYPGLLDSLMTGAVVRPRFGGHPRLAIWGPMEARLQHCDLMILGGLNEGTWPAETDPGPWLSRPMRSDFGLPPVEQRIGLMAHDFAQAFGAPEVVLTRATRVEGTPTVPSRWLLRLDTVLKALDVPPLESADAGPWLDWVAALDRPARTQPGAPPAPAPPVSARPRKLSVTWIETWMRDPYALYARKILGLAALDPIDQDPGAAEHGSLIHAALEAFTRAHPDTLPPDTLPPDTLPDNPEAALLACGRDAFAARALPPGLRAYWWPRFVRIARWIAAQERERRSDGRRVVAESLGHMTLDGPAGSFTLTAKADRIEVTPDGALCLIDYKTGQIPRTQDVDLGFAPQLPLEAAIASDPGAGFEGIAPAAVAELAYWRLTGGPTPGEAKALKRPPGELAAEARAGVARLIARFDDPATPYHALPRPDFAPRYSETDHLARRQEWGSAEAETGEG